MKWIIPFLLMISSAHADQFDYWCIFTNAAAAQADSVVGTRWLGTVWDTSVTFPAHKIVTAAALINGISPITGFQIIISTVGPDAALHGNSACFLEANRDAACRAQSFVVGASVTGTNRTNATLSPVPAGSCYPRPLGQ